MRNDAGDVVDREASLVERLFRGVDHRDDGLFVDLLARHLDGLEVVVDVLAVIGGGEPPPGIQRMSAKFAVARRCGC